MEIALTIIVGLTGILTLYYMVCGFVEIYQGKRL